MVTNEELHGAVAEVLHVLGLHSDIEVYALAGVGADGAKPLVGLRISLPGPDAPVVIERMLVNQDGLAVGSFQVWVAGYVSSAMDLYDAVRPYEELTSSASVH